MLNKLVKIFVLSFITLFIFSSILTPLFVACSSIIGSSDINVGSFTFQRKTFYANGLFWVFYLNGTYAVYRSSSDGAIWSADTILTNSFLYSFDFSVCTDGVHICYAATGEDAPLLFREGILNANGTITWMAAEQIVPTTYYKTYYPTIALDSDGYAWIAYIDNNAGFLPFVTKSRFNNGTFGASPTGFPYKLNAGVDANWYIALTALTNGKVAVVLKNFNSVMNITTWDGSAWRQSAVTTGGSAWLSYFSITNHGDNVIICYENATAYALKYAYYNYSTNSFTNEEVIQTGVSSMSAAYVSIDTFNNTYVFWTNENTLYYKERVYANGSWSPSPIVLSAETSISNAHASVFSKQYGNYIGIIYPTGSAGSYNATFAYLTPTAPIADLTVSSTIANLTSNFSAQFTDCASYQFGSNVTGSWSWDDSQSLSTNPQTVTITKTLPVIVDSIVAYQWIAVSNSIGNIYSSDLTTFATTGYTITVANDSYTSISPQTCSVPYGSSPVFTYNANQNCALAQVTVDGSAITLSGNSYTFSNVQAAHTISVSGYSLTIEDISLPYTITERGNYRIVSIGTYSGVGTGLTVQASNVVVDGNNVLIRGAGYDQNSVNNIGISISSTSKNVVVKNAYIENEYIGIKMLSNTESNNIIQDSVLNHNGFSGGLLIMLSSNFTVNNVVSSYNAKDETGVGFGLTISYSSDFNVINCDASYNNDQGIVVSDDHDFTISNCTATYNSNEAFTTISSYSYTIKNCTAYKYGTAILAYRGHNILIDNFNALGNWATDGTGIYNLDFHNTTDYIIQNSNIYSNYSIVGIALDARYSTNGTIRNSTLSYAYIGVFGDYSNDLSIQNNTINTCTNPIKAINAINLVDADNVITPSQLPSPTPTSTSINSSARASPVPIHTISPTQAENFGVNDIELGTIQPNSTVTATLYFSYKNSPIALQSITFSSPFNSWYRHDSAFSTVPYILNYAGVNNASVTLTFQIPADVAVEVFRGTFTVSAVDAFGVQMSSSANIHAAVAGAQVENSWWQFFLDRPVYLIVGVLVIIALVAITLAASKRRR